MPDHADRGARLAERHTIRGRNAVADRAGVGHGRRHRDCRLDKHAVAERHRDAIVLRGAAVDADAFQLAIGDPNAFARAVTDRDAAA